MLNFGTSRSTAIRISRPQKESAPAAFQPLERGFQGRIANPSYLLMELGGKQTAGPFLRGAKTDRRESLWSRLADYCSRASTFCGF